MTVRKRLFAWAADGRATEIQVAEQAPPGTVEVTAMLDDGLCYCTAGEPHNTDRHIWERRIDPDGRTTGYVAALSDPRYTATSQRLHIERHEHWVGTGYCPSVHGKSWCNAASTRHDRHYAFGVGVTPTLFWTDREADGCPCPPRQSKP